MKTSILPIITLMVGSLYAADIENGKELFNEANCMECHIKQHFTNSKLKDIPGIFQKASACAVAHDAGWFDEDTMDVAHYLNKEYYKLNEKK